MAKITSIDGKLPKNIEGYSVYALGDAVIIRAKSGFTRDGVLHSSKYLKSRHNYTEFGRLSSACRYFRAALVGILPKQHNLLVVNQFTAIMRKVMVCDLISIYGERNLGVALKTEAGRALLKGYGFNPKSAIDLKYVVDGDVIAITLGAYALPERATVMGFRMHVLDFDFECMNGQLISSGLSFYDVDGLNTSIVLDMPKIADTTGVVFKVLEVSFFECVGGDFLSVECDGSKSVLVVGVE
jgi:hypothetical protein